MLALLFPSLAAFGYLGLNRVNILKLSPVLDVLAAK